MPDDNFRTKLPLSEIFSLLVQLDTIHIKFAGKVVDAWMTSFGIDALVSLKMKVKLGTSYCTQPKSRPELQTVNK